VPEPGGRVGGQAQLQLQLQPLPAAVPAGGGARPRCVGPQGRQRAEQGGGLLLIGAAAAQPQVGRPAFHGVGGEEVQHHAMGLQTQQRAVRQQVDLQRGGVGGRVHGGVVQVRRWAISQGTSAGSS